LNFDGSDLSVEDYKEQVNNLIEQLAKGDIETEQKIKLLFRFTVEGENGEEWGVE
jgi:hypothetical protein